MMKSEVKRSFYTTVNHPFSIENTEEVACNLCGSARYRPLGTELSFDIRQCRDCGLVYVSPQPLCEEFARFYGDMYLDAPETVQAVRPPHVENHLRSILVARKPRGGRLLEVGCGEGRFLERIADLPWELEAIELSEAAAERARRRVPAAAIQCVGLDDAAFPAGRFDCIAMVAVLEHVKDPRSTLERVTRWLAPGGLLILQVPYIAGFIRLKRWLPWLPIHFEAPRHLFDFSPRAVSRYLGEQGYRDIRTEIARPYASPTRLGLALVWGVKIPGFVLYRLTGRRYIYPFAAAITVYAVKPSGETSPGSP